MKKIIQLYPISHRGEKQIALWFDKDIATRSYIKAFDGVRWTRTHTCFYISYSSSQLKKIIEYLTSGGYFIRYKSFTNSNILETSEESLKGNTAKMTKKELYFSLPLPFKELLKNYIGYLKGKRLSKNTIKSYGYFALRLIYLLRNKNIKDWDNKDLDYYMAEVMAKENYSISSHRQCVSSLKYFTAFCDLLAFDASNFARPKKSKYLPVVLSDYEIIKLLQFTKNLKHRTIIALLYSGGLRIGELLQLKPEDIDFSRNLIHIKNGKGRKDRMVGLSETIKPLLRNYLHTYRPNLFLIEGREGSLYTASSVRNFLKATCRKSGIKKKVSPHTLRHSYATHMLESGVDLRYIQELLGHAKPETTMIYTHVAQKDLSKLRNPLDVAIERITTSSKGDKKVLIS